MELTKIEKEMIWALANNMMNKCLDLHMNQTVALDTLRDTELKSKWFRETNLELKLLQKIKEKMKNE